MSSVLYQGDCLEIMPVKIPDKSVDMILCDLPYGTTACKWDVVIPFEPLWKEYKRIIKDRGCIALFGSEPFSSYLRMSNIKDYKYDWVWLQKRPTGFANSKKQPLRNIENIIIFNTKNYYPQGLEKVNKINKNSKSTGGDSIRKNVLESIGKGSLRTPGKIFITEFKNFPRQTLYFSSDFDKIHPTQKPIKLLEYMIRTYTLENETVLDNTMGSGSTGVACVNTNRNFIGIEKEENYFNIAQKRIQEAENNFQPELMEAF